MSQRECAGFNWPPLSISAEEPVSNCPSAVIRAGPSGVGHPDTWATAFRLTVALLPSARFPVVLASFAICDPSAFPFVGVGHPACCTACGRMSVLSEFTTVGAAPSL